MRLKLLIPALIAVLGLSAAACGPSAREVPLQATYDDFGRNKNQSRDITVRMGNVVKLTAASNPSTGFKWELGSISDPALVMQSGMPEYIPPASSLAGAGGQEVWTFQTLKRGKGSITMAYSRPWEGGTKAEWTLTINLTVK